MMFVLFSTRGPVESLRNSLKTFRTPGFINRSMKLVALFHSFSHKLPRLVKDYVSML